MPWIVKITDPAGESFSLLADTQDVVARIIADETARGQTVAVEDMKGNPVEQAQFLPSTP